LIPGHIDYYVSAGLFQSQFRTFPLNPSTLSSYRKTDPDNFLDDAGVEEKVRSLLDPISDRERIDVILENLWAFEAIENIAEVTDLLCQMRDGGNLMTEETRKRYEEMLGHLYSTTATASISTIHSGFAKLFTTKSVVAGYGGSR